MKLAITDACIFIELDQLRLTSAFFKLNIEVHTSVDVFNELFPQQQEVLKAYEIVAKLRLHTLTSEDRARLHNGSYNSGLSENDRTVLLLADELDAMVLSTDGLVRKHAQKKAVECHGMFWIFDELVDHGLINKPQALLALRQMITQNMIYQNNPKLLKEAAARLGKWAK
jgi:predicted nucleic acid-binding protein